MNSELQKWEISQTEGPEKGSNQSKLLSCIGITWPATIGKETTYNFSSKVKQADTTNYTIDECSLSFPRLFFKGKTYFAGMCPRIDNQSMNMSRFCTEWGEQDPITQDNNTFYIRIATLLLNTFAGKNPGPIHTDTGYSIFIQEGN